VPAGAGPVLPGAGDELPGDEVLPPTTELLGAPDTATGVPGPLQAGTTTRIRAPINPAAAARLIARHGTSETPRRFLS